MNLKKILISFAASLLVCTTVYAQGNVVVRYDGKLVNFTESPIIRNDKTLVQLRPIADALGIGIVYVNETKQVYLYGQGVTVVFTNNSDIIKVNGRDVKMAAPVCNYKDYTFVPVRDIVEPFGKAVDYNPATKAVDINTPGNDGYWYSDGSHSSGMLVRPGAVDPLPIRDVSSGNGQYSSSFYYQGQPDLGLENNGKGYCWVCSYAMLITNVTGQKVTPIDIANVNIENGYSGCFMFHSAIMNRFACKFVPALPETSPYFGGYNTKKKGDTSLVVNSDEDVIRAISEALTLHPNGVMVRFEGYPHTMLAVSCENGVIYFNDPALASGEHIPFENTCLKKYKLTDISYIQAMTKK
ncbi:MAG: copper amine oxidase N-terminal domain-containing protein [Ruminococcaceae bacterium]|nr:copper amine oxidase N-terminal domain-containing protein [Oscillospiraceae bacterium]